VTVSYASGSKLAKQAAGEAARLLVREGVSAHAVRVTPHEGRANDVTLAFVSKFAQTKPCGDWSENLRANQFNDSGPNFGCAFQQNFAAMVANPEDLEAPQVADRATSAAQKPALDNYESGEWHKPIEDDTLSNSF
jgi:pilus assembly protein CpaD